MRHYKPISLGKTQFCLDVEGASKKNGANIIRFPCNNGPNQKFYYNGKTKQIIAKHSKKCVELKNGHSVQTKCKTKKNTQKWKYNNKTKRIVPIKSKKGK